MNLFPTNATRVTRARRVRRSALLFAVTAAAFTFAAAQTSGNRKESRLDIAPGGNINIVNASGSVTLHSASSGHQVLVAYTTHSDKIEVDQNTTANKQRIELRTHALSGQHPTADEAKVDYEITVPAGVSVNVTTVSAPVTAEGLSGDVSLSSETGQIVVHNIAKSHLRVRSMNAPVSLTNVTLANIDVQSSAGPVHMNAVTGPRVTVGTANGNIDYHGDCAGGGDYIFSTHSGDIEMWLPASASVDLSAHSRTGSVENEFPLEAKSHQVNPPVQGRSFAGTSNSGSSSVELQSISGKIRVKKQ
jgi:DUF4097 and DUF4098 domain-containing protein YvlB